MNQIRIVRYILWTKTWILYLVKLWFSLNLSKLTQLFGRRNNISEVVNRLAAVNQPRIAVIALFPVNDSIYELSVRNLILGLNKNDVHVVLLLNRNASESLNRLFIETNCTVIKRKNVGRDFGAYKDGVLWLEKEFGLDRIERLLFINDTLVWLNDGKEMIQTTMKSDWSALFLNLEIHTHAQSFFLSFSNNVVNDKKFLKFWRTYIPTEHRRLAILNGEIKLSETLIKRGYRCIATVKPSIFKSVLLDGQLDQATISLLGSLTLSEMAGMTPPGVTPGRKEPGVELQKFVGLDKLKSDIEIDQTYWNQMVVRMLSQYCNSHAPHRIGLQLYVLFGIPLKTDIYKCYTLSEIFNCINLKNPEYADEVIDFLSGKSQQFMEGSRVNVKRRKLGEI